MTHGLKFLAAAVALAGATPASAQVDEATLANPPGCVTVTSTPAEREAATKRVVAAMRGPRPGMPDTPAPPPEAQTFGLEMSALARENVFTDLWARCGLSRRDRSLVTLGILIALRADSELRYHFPIGIRNGLTRKELEEVVIHAMGYAGTPAAASARAAAEESLRAR